MRLALLVLAAAAAALPALAGRADVLAPARGALLGASIDFGAYNYNLTNYERRLGRQPASWVLFMSFPLNPVEVSNAQYMIQQMARRKAIVILTLEPYGGLRPARNRAALDALSRQARRPQGDAEGACDGALQAAAHGCGRRACLARAAHPSSPLGTPDGGLGAAGRRARCPFCPRNERCGNYREPRACSTAALGDAVCAQPSLNPDAFLLAGSWYPWAQRPNEYK